MGERYVIMYGNEIIKSYQHLKQAMKDMEFFTLIYKEVYMYQLVMKSDELQK